MTIQEIPCYVARGGTSKGVFIDESALPEPGPERDLIILKLMGSPDIRQIDGLGGGDPLTSKVAIISPSSEPGCDINYLSAEVRLNKMEVNYGIMCGNLASAVALVAGDLGYVSLPELEGVVNIHNHNSGKQIGVKIDPEQRYTTGREQQVNLVFKDPGGAVTGVVLPTGKAREKIDFNGVELDCSIVDAGTLYTYVRAASVGLRGDESPLALDEDRAFKALIESLRSVVTRHVNGCLEDNRKIHAGNVKVAIVSDPDDLEPSGSVCDIVSRIINPVKTHKAFAISGAVCLGAAAFLDGTLVNEIVTLRGSGDSVRVGHPSGVMEVITRRVRRGGDIHIHAAEVHRSARILMKGTAFVSL